VAVTSARFEAESLLRNDALAEVVSTTATGLPNG